MYLSQKGCDRKSSPTCFDARSNKLDWRVSQLDQIRLRRAGWENGKVQYNAQGTMEWSKELGKPHSYDGVKESGLCKSDENIDDQISGIKRA